MARISVVAQPFPTQTGAMLEGWLRSRWAREFLGASAWAKRSGLRRIRGALRRFRARGGRSVLIVGVDEGGATPEGLKAAMVLFDQVTVFHDTGGRTFHPKVFIVEGATEARALVGSSNLTAGGLFTNFEVSIAVRLDKSKPRDRRLLDELKRSVLHFQSLGAAAQPLTPALLAKMLTDPTLSIQSEKAAKSRRAGTKGAASGVFGPPVPGLPRAPKLARKAAKARSGKVVGASGPATPAGATSSRPASAAAHAGGSTILIAEIPKAGTRWEQANFDLATFTGFFGLSTTSSKGIDVQHVQLTGARDPIEPRPGVSVKSQNYRIELAALKGLAHPAGAQRPLVLFRQVSRQSFEYHAVMPASPGYSQISALLSKHAGPGGARMRRPQLPATVVRAAWPGCPI